MPIRQQAIIWTNGGLGYWHIYASIGLNDLILEVPVLYIANYWSINCLFNSLFRLTTKIHQRYVLLPVCEGKPSVTSGFPTQMDSKAENVFIWWRHNGSFMTEMYAWFFSTFFDFYVFCITVVYPIWSFKMADEIKWNLMTRQVLKSCRWMQCSLCSLSNLKATSTLRHGVLCRSEIITTTAIWQ